MVYFIREREAVMTRGIHNSLKERCNGSWHTLFMTRKLQCLIEGNLQCQVLYIFHGIELAKANGIHNS